MKNLITAISLVLISLNALALPVLDDNGTGLYPDHKDANKVYFMPTEGALLKYDNGTPQFSLAYWGGTEASGVLTGIFEMRKSSRIQKLIDEALAKGKKVAVLPMTGGEFVIDDQEGLFDVIDLPPYVGPIGTSMGVTAELSAKGVEVLPEILRTNPESVTLFSVCYKVSGVIKFNGGYKELSKQMCVDINLAEVKGFPELVINVDEQDL